MGIFFNNNLKSILEVEINGEKQETEEEDYTAGADGGSEEETPEDTTSDTDDTEDYTAGADSAGDETTDGDEGSEEEPEEDYTAGADAAGDDESDEETPEDTTSDIDDTEDYTAGADSAGDETTDGDEGSEDTSETESEGDSEETSEDDNSFENLKKIEAELFSNLNPEQIAIKNYELKQNFINLYTTIGTTLIRINDVVKSDDNIETLKFITDKLLELREMIDFNITTAYQTRTYIENNIIYQQCLSTLNAITDIISSIPSPSQSDENKNSDEENIVDSELEDSENNTNSEKLDVGDKMIENTQFYNVYL